MDVAFANNDLRRRFEHSDIGVRVWGGVVARKYIQRVLELQAATSIAELQALRSLRLHPLRGEREGEWSLILHGRWRMLVRFEGNTAHISEVSNHYGD